MGQDRDLDTTVLSSLTALITDKIKLPESGCISQLKIMFLIKIIPVEKEVKYTSFISQVFCSSHNFMCAW